MDVSNRAVGNGPMFNRNVDNADVGFQDIDNICYTDFFYKNVLFFCLFLQICSNCFSTCCGVKTRACESFSRTTS